MKNIHLLSLILIFFISCKSPKTQITNTVDYDKYLQFENYAEANNLAQKELDFWTNKYNKATNQTPYLIKMAAANMTNFGLSADVSFLNTAAAQIEKVNKMEGSTHAGTLQNLAQTYISMHRFQDAYKCISIADSLGEKKHVSQMMLFDVALEIGNKQEAFKILQSTSDKEDFNYNIRLAKWYDQEGKTEDAIAALEKAKTKAEKANDKEQKLWIYTNIADFYGHEGHIEKAYKSYLKSLELDPNNTYALKGIAWILFSKEKNTEEAKRIIYAIQKKHNSPDYLLILAQIAKYEGNEKEYNSLFKKFCTEVQQPKYGDMYNAYLINNLDINTLDLAKKEIKNRPTAMSYDELAWSYFKNGQLTEANEILNKFVIGKTFEPLSLYHRAVIAKKQNKIKEVADLKNELKNAYFELGPIYQKNIENI